MGFALYIGFLVLASVGVTGFVVWGILNMDSTDPREWTEREWAEWFKAHAEWKARQARGDYSWDD